MKARRGQPPPEGGPVEQEISSFQRSLRRYRDSAIPWVVMAIAVALYVLFLALVMTVLR
jgi:hypothetical protein